MSIIDNFKDAINLVRQIDNRELYEKILDLQAEAQELQQQIFNQKESIRKKDQKIEELKEKFKIKKELKYKDRAYYIVDDKGEPIGEPYCPRCWDADQKLIHIQTAPRPVQRMNKKFSCPNCEQHF